MPSKSKGLKPNLSAGGGAAAPGVGHGVGIMGAGVTAAGVGHGGGIVGGAPEVCHVCRKNNHPRHATIPKTTAPAVSNNRRADDRAVTVGRSAPGPTTLSIEPIELWFAPTVPLKSIH